MVMSVIMALVGLSVVGVVSAIAVALVNDARNDRYQCIGQCSDDETMVVLDKRTGLVKIAMYRLPEKETPDA